MNLKSLWWEKSRLSQIIPNSSSVLLICFEKWIEGVIVQKIVSKYDSKYGILYSSSKFHSYSKRPWDPVSAESSNTIRHCWSQQKSLKSISDFKTTCGLIRNTCTFGTFLICEMKIFDSLWFGSYVFQQLIMTFSISGMKESMITLLIIHTFCWKTYLWHDFACFVVLIGVFALFL